MKWLQLLVGAGLFLSIAEGVQMFQVKEESGITLNCTVIKSNGSLIWTRRDGNSTRTMAGCVPGRPCDISYQPYTATVTGFNDSHWISFFNITKAARIDQGLWSCYVDTGTVSVCDLKVFTRPINIMCSQPELHKDQVMVTCTGEKVFPDPLCHFSWYKDSKEETSLAGAVVNQSSYEQGNPSYFYPTCTWSIPVKSLGFGSHQFKVLVYPSVTGTNADMDYGANSSLTSPVNIITPDVTFESCPVGQVKDGFIQEGTTASCTCRETNNKFVLANTSWSGSQGEQLTWGMQNSSFTFLAEKNSQIQGFTCQADILGRRSTSKIYVPQVAFGPNQVVVKVNINNTDRDVIDLCGKPLNINISIYCAASDVNPDATFQYFINKTELLGNPSSVVEISKSGCLSVECNATNSKFEALSISNTTFIEVTEPPNPPLIKIDQGTFSSDGRQVTVKEGIVQVRCQVEGGYPPVSNLTLDCGGFSATLRNGDFVDVNITRKMNSQPCSCTANHTSSCYVNNKVTTVLNVMYPPTVTDFSVTDPATQTVENNTKVTFSCKAEGNPSPELSLEPHFLDMLENISGNNSASLKFSKTMTCQDTGVYVCKAQANGDRDSKSVELNVLCRYQLGTSEIQHRVYTARTDQSLDITISVFGYPNPDLHLESTKFIDQSAYDLIYINRMSPEGVVSITFHSVNESYFQEYNLSVTNSLGSLVYTFQITSDSKSRTNVGAIAGGIAAGVFIIIVIVLAVFILRRNGFPSKKTKERKGDDHRAISAHHDGEVMVDNMDIYDLDRKSNEVLTVVFDNSDIYSMNHNDAVVIDNSDIYNMNHSEAENRRSAYKKYSDITPTITSATAAPKNMKTVVEEPVLDNPYEDVERDAKTQKPQVASKPKPAIKPKTEQSSPAKVPTEGKKGIFELQDDGKNQTYASVNKVPKSSTQQATSTQSTKDGFFSDPNQAPDVSDKKYKKGEKNVESEKKKDKADEIPLQDKKTGSSAHTDGVSSSQDSSFAYTNSGFSDMGEDMNVYANTEKVQDEYRS